jgi:hypothetical protein
VREEENLGPLAVLGTYTDTHDICRAVSQALSSVRPISPDQKDALIRLALVRMGAPEMPEVRFRPTIPGEDREQQMARRKAWFDFLCTLPSYNYHQFDLKAILRDNFGARLFSDSSPTLELLQGFLDSTKLRQPWTLYALADANGSLPTEPPATEDESFTYRSGEARGTFWRTQNGRERDRWTSWEDTLLHIAIWARRDDVVRWVLPLISDADLEAPNLVYVNFDGQWQWRRFSARQWSYYLYREGLNMWGNFWRARAYYPIYRLITDELRGRSMSLHSDEGVLTQSARESSDASDED